LFLILACAFRAICASLFLPAIITKNVTFKQLRVFKNEKMRTYSQKCNAYLTWAGGRLLGTLLHQHMRHGLLKLPTLHPSTSSRLLTVSLRSIKGYQLWIALQHSESLLQTVTFLVGSKTSDPSQQPCCFPHTVHMLQYFLVTNISTSRILIRPDKGVFPLSAR
jgi:hypothetical protein